MTPANEEEELECKALSKEFQDWARTRKRHIADLLEAESEDIGETLSQIEIGSGMALYRVATSKEIVESVAKAFVSEPVAFAIIALKLPDRDEREGVIGSVPKLTNLVTSCRRIACWILWVYKALNPERSKSLWEHMETKKYNVANLKATAHLRLAEYLLHDLLSPTDGSTLAYVVSPGSTPFFGGVAVQKDASLCQFLKQKLEPDQATDSPADIEAKKFMRSCIRCPSSSRFSTFHRRSLQKRHCQLLFN